MTQHCITLQYVARLIFSGCQCNHITPLLVQLHWLRVPQRIEYKLCCVLVYHCLHEMAPEYLASSFQRVSDVTTRRHLHSAATSQLIVPTTCHVLFNTWQPSVPCRHCTHLERSSALSSAPSLPTFRQSLKIHLFYRSFYSQFCLF